MQARKQAIVAADTVSSHILHARVQKIAKTSPSTVAEVRTAFERQKIVEYSIASVSGSDLQVTKENDKMVIKFAYDKEVELFEPVFLLIKYRGEGRSN